MQIFPAHSLLTTEYQQICDYLIKNCISKMGQELVVQMIPVSNKSQIDELLFRTDEMRQILASGLPFPTTGYNDLSKELSLLKIENSVLSERQFLDILTMMHTIFGIFQFFKNRKGQFQYLEQILETSYYEPFIAKEIENIIDETGSVRTSASTELTRIRRALQRSRAESDRIYSGVISRYRKKGWLTDSEESSRNGRRVIAIFAEQKRSVNGVIHDSSATGKTSFVEPEEAIGINNSISLLENEELQELKRILRELTSAIRKYHSLIVQYRSLLGELDFNRSKALLAIATDSHLPRVVSDSQIKLIQARHPLLLMHNNRLKKPTIPFSLELNNNDRILVISGPNAGGKTVCMKTSGLLQMMLQSGLLVSAHPDSEFGIFQNLMVDIGDSQSIEYELSTYSSRLRHMKIFLDQVNDNSLFLIDEFGTGTDPNLGGALAEAVLEELNRRKAIGIITTHYLNLKVMADQTEGIMNGSMEFDLKKLQPLYRLVIGKPGSSYTFLVAERSGLPAELIKNARRKVARKNLMLERLLTEVQGEKSQLKHKLSEADQNAKLLKEQIRKYDLLTKQHAENFDQKEAKLKKLELKILRESEEKFRSFLKEWKKSKDKKEVFDKYYKQFVRKQKKESPEAAERKRKEKLRQLLPLIKPGVEVRLQNGHTKGVVEQVDDEKAFVIFGQFRTLCDIVNLVPAEAEKKK